MAIERSLSFFATPIEDLDAKAIAVLDEATASIDNETDAILQTCIRDVFTSATVLTIAHRLHTIMDSSQVMLFDKGALKEHAPPDTLLTGRALPVTLSSPPVSSQQLRKAMIKRRNLTADQVRQHVAEGRHVTPYLTPRISRYR